MSLTAEAADLLVSLGVARQAFTGGALAVRSPVDGSALGAVHETRDPASEIARSAQAFQHWRNVPAPRRGELVRLLGEELRAHKQALGRLVALEIGKIESEGLGEVQEMID